MPITNLNSITTTAASSTLLTTAAHMIYDRITAERYSDQNIRDLNKIKAIYKETLQPPTLTSGNGIIEFSTPAYWELDGDKKPNLGIKINYWDNYINELNCDKPIGSYHYQAQQIAAYAATYLRQRRKRSPLAGKGKPGDILELIIGEWIDFALTDLRFLNYDQMAINKIERRLNYLERLVKDETLLRYGTFTREKNKFDTLESIKQQLESCHHVAHEEKQRACARETFSQCRNNTKALLLTCIKFIYYVRKTPVDHEPLEIENYINPHKKIISTAAQNIYPILKKSYSGKMMAEIIKRVGLAAFGIYHDVESGPVDYNFYDNQNKPREFLFDKKMTDFPDWVKPHEQLEQIRQLQLFGAYILAIGELKNLIELAYDLTGAVGDLWAYGDPIGKKSLNILIILMNTEINAVKTQTDIIYQYHNRARQEYNLKKHINPSKSANPNFNYVDSISKEIASLYSLLKNNIQVIKDQMQSFPDNIAKKINDKKSFFYRSMIDFINKNCPEQIKNFNFLPAAPYQGFIDFTVNNNPLYVKYTEINMRFILTNVAGFNYLAKPEAKKFKPEKNYILPLPKWTIGKSYSLWVHSFLTASSSYIDKHHSLIDMLINDLNSNNHSITNLYNHKNIILKNIKHIEDKIHTEQPKWRFKWAIWPIQTVGWPFNGYARRFSLCMLNEITLIKFTISQSIQHKISYLSQENLGKFTEQNTQAKFIPPSADVTPSTRLIQEIFSANTLLDTLHNFSSAPEALAPTMTLPAQDPPKTTQFFTTKINDNCTSDHCLEIKHDDNSTAANTELTKKLPQPNAFNKLERMIVTKLDAWSKNTATNLLDIFTSYDDAIDALNTIKAADYEFADCHFLIKEINYYLASANYNPENRKQLILVKKLLIINTADQHDLIELSEKFVSLSQKYLLTIKPINPV